MSMATDDPLVAELGSKISRVMVEDGAPTKWAVSVMMLFMVIDGFGFVPE
jgi:hypothetical protein